MSTSSSKEVSQRQDARSVFPILVPFIIVILLAGSMRLLKWNQNSSDDQAAQKAARSMVGPELHRLRTALDQKNAESARSAAESFARRNLSLQSTEKIRDMVVQPRKKGQYRVRGVVEWLENGNRVTRHFEADLVLGPADDKWRLVDTEYVP